jgi:5-deoxy-glucuronate isomerase
MPDEELYYRSKKLEPSQSGILINISPREAGWNLITFQVRRLVLGDLWQEQTGDNEACLVLLRGTCQLDIEGEQAVLGSRKSVFDSYPHCAYLPSGTRFRVQATELCELAYSHVPARKKLEPKIIPPEECGCEIRGGGNATRQIIDIIPPEFPADRLLVCEVLTPSGNWSSYPPHKHDEDRPPREVKLEETYYYRFATPEGYGIQRLYYADGSLDKTWVLRDGDLLLIKQGYHPFVTAFGYHAYYLNVLAGEHRSMAAVDDPQYAELRKAWPEADPRLPLLEKPAPRSGNRGWK